VAIALPSFKKEISSLFITRISAIIFIYSGVLALNALYIQSIGSGIGIYSGLFHVTIISQLLDVFLLILASLILIAWPLINSSYYNKVISLTTILTDGSSPLKNISTNKYTSSKLNFIGLYTPRTEYCLIVLFSGLGSSLLISSSDLLSMYLSIELQSFGLYILATLYRDYESATASGLKYFLLGGLSSCFILLGAGLIYNFTGLTNFESLYSLISVSDVVTSNIQNIISGVSLGLIFIFIGFLFKIAAAPLHSWSPDVYDQTPTQVTIWLTIIPKISILFLLLELQNGLSINSIIDLPVYENIINHLSNNILDINYNTSYILKILLLISSLFSLIIGTIVGLAQTRIKRLLAYSTISHIGFILLALAINTEQSTDSFIFYIIQYSITNLNIFLIIIALGFIINKNGIKLYSKNIFFFDYDIRFLSTLKGQFFVNPILSISLVICLFSMAGVPPLLGFFSKQFVLLSAVQSGYWFMAFVAILTSVISASYYLRVVILLVTQNTNKNITQNSFNNESILTNFHSFLISTITLSILLFIFKPTLLLNSTQLLSLSYFNY
jgi:NADH-ubiquinone oxidoreductase chain 2